MSSEAAALPSVLMVTPAHLCQLLIYSLLACCFLLSIDVDAEMVLDNISYARAYTHEHQMSLLTLACARMVEERIALVIVDSAMALFRVDFSELRTDEETDGRKCERCSSAISNYAHLSHVLPVSLGLHIIGGRGMLADRQIKLGQFLSQLTKMDEEFNTAVYITNQVVTDCTGTTMGEGMIVTTARCTRFNMHVLHFDR